MKKPFQIALFALLSTYSLVSSSQDFKDQFNQFKTTNEKAYEKAIREQDSVFAKSIIDNWRAFQLTEPEEKEPELPKPEEQPKADLGLEIKEILHKILEKPQSPKLMRSFNQPKLEKEENYTDFELSEGYVFHGEEVKFNYSGRFLKANDLTISNEHGLSEAWDVLSKSPYRNIVNTLYEKSLELNLPDYGYLLLIDSFLKELDISDQSKAVYQWFLLAKSGYSVRVGLIDKKPVLVVGSYGKIYGKRYFTISGINYYVLSDRAGKFESYQADFDEDENPFDFALEGEIKLPLDPVKKDFQYESKGKDINISVYYNANMVKLLEQFPQSDLVYYLSSSSSDLLKKSVEKSFQPYLEGLNTVGKVQFLMTFVQKAFEYESDKVQFGKERVMYPEELFFHSSSDCDDRVVLLAYLLRTFTDVPMVALSFPQHVALGLRLPSATFGETIKYKGYTFTFCDPTYLNAPLGSVIPQADRSKISVIDF
ncbi:MAG: hypothetical protein JXR03_07120 [Cyclobacteriaceae bacterium]